MSYQDFLQKYGTETELDTLSAFDQFMINQEIQKQKEEEERLRLEEENRIKEAERKAAEIEAARVPENPTFDEIEKYMIMEESSGDKDSVNINNDGTLDVSKHGLNELWINQFPTSGKEDPEHNGIKPWIKQKDGTLDPVYAMIHDYMREQIPNWDNVSDSSRLEIIKDEVYSQPIARFIHDYRGPKQWSSYEKFMEAYQTDLRSQSLDSLTADAFQGNNPTLDSIASRINLDTTAISETTGIAPIDVRTEGEKWTDRIAEAERPKTLADAINKYAKDPVRLVPFLNTSSDIKEIIDITSIMGRVDKATEEGVEPNQEDMLRLYEYQQANQAETSFGYKVGTVLGELPAFALEIGFTGGIYTGTKTATLKGAKYAIKRALGKELKDKTAKYLAKHKILDGSLNFGVKSAAAISGATMQTIVNEGIKEVGAWVADDWLPGGRIRLGMKEHMMGTLPITMQESGELEAAVFTEGDDFNEAFAKSATDFWIEMVSERSGGAFTKIGSIGRKWAAKQGILKKFLELNPTKKVKDFNKLINRYGWNGVLGEMGEERIGEAARGVAYEVGIEDEGFKYKLPTMDQLAVEFVSFLIPGVTIAGIRGTLGKTGDNNDPIPEFDLNDPAEVKKALIAQGGSVKVVENEGAWDVNTYIGETLIDQSTGYKDKKDADATAKIVEKDLTHYANAIEVTAEEELPTMEEEGVTVEAVEEAPAESENEKVIREWESGETDFGKKDAIENYMDAVEAVKGKSIAGKQAVLAHASKEEEAPAEVTPEDEMSEQEFAEQIGIAVADGTIDLEDLAIAAADMTGDMREQIRDEIAKLNPTKAAQFTPYEIGEKKYGGITPAFIRAAQKKIANLLAEEAPAEITYTDIDGREKTVTREDAKVLLDAAEKKAVDKDFSPSNREEASMRAAIINQALEAPAEAAPAVEEAPAEKPKFDKKKLLTDLHKRSAELTSLQKEIKADIKYENELSKPDPTRLANLKNKLAEFTADKETVVKDIRRAQGVEVKGKMPAKKAPVKVERVVFKEGSKQGSDYVKKITKMSDKELDTESTKIDKLINKAKKAGTKRLYQQKKSAIEDMLEERMPVTVATGKAAPTKVVPGLVEQAEARKAEELTGGEAQISAEREALTGLSMSELSKRAADVGIEAPETGWNKEQYIEALTGKVEVEREAPIVPQIGMAPAEEVERFAAPEKIVFTGKNKTSQTKKNKTIKDWLLNNGMDRAVFLKEFTDLAPSKEDRGGLSRAEYKNSLEDAYDDAVNALDPVAYAKIMEKTTPTHIDKNGDKHDFTELDKDDIVYLNGSFGLTPEMLDTVGKALVDTGRYVYENLSPAMQKLGNRVGVNAQNFKLKFAQFKNNSKEMTDNAKKWFKKVVGHMKAWFKRNAKNLIESKPVQKAYKRLEDMVVLKAVPEGVDILGDIRRSIEEAEAEVKAKGGKKRKPSETPYYKKVRAGRIQPKIDRQDNTASSWGQMFYLLSGRLKKVTGGMGILRALRGYEKHALTIEDDLKKAEPWLKFLHKLQPSKLKPWRNKGDWKQLENALLKGNQAAILEIVDKYNAREAYDSMREMLDGIYYRAVNLTQKEKVEYDKLILDLAKARKEVPNKSWNVDSIKVWLIEEGVEYKKTKVVDGKTRSITKEDLLDIVLNSSKGMQGKRKRLEKNEERFAKLDKKIIYNFPYWGDDISVYFPRDVIDPAAFNGYLTGKIGTGEMNKIEESLRDRHGIKMGQELPPGMLAQAIDAYLRTGGATVRGAKPGAIKGRVIERKTEEGITDDMVPYYSDPITSLMGYIHKMNESIARQKLFGKGVDIDNPNNSENVGAFVEGLITGENELGVKINRKDQEEIKDIFQARFANSWGKFGGVVQTVKNATYMSSLVDIFTTFIQTGDLFTGALYRAPIYRNPIILTKAITKAFLGQIPLVNKFVRSPIDARKYGLIRISAEYTNKGEWLGRALGKAFKLSGFAAIDRMGKEALVNATIMRAQKEAKKGKLSPKTQNLIRDAFGPLTEDLTEFNMSELKAMAKVKGIIPPKKGIGKDMSELKAMAKRKGIKAKKGWSQEQYIEALSAWSQEQYIGALSKRSSEVVGQLEAGKINDDIISLAYWTLLEHQPVAESEMTALYLRSSGAKLFYQLKTWQMKQLSLWRSETVGMWNKGQKGQAIKNGIHMGILLGLAGAAPDVIRDFFQGRPIHLTDFAAENLFRLFGISKYSAERGATGEFEFFVGGAVPASRLVSAVGKDMVYLNKWLQWAKDPIFNKPPEETPKYGLSTTNLIPLFGKQLYTGLPFPRIPRSMEEIKKMTAGVPDSENGWIIEGWRGRKQILKRQVTYYDELTDEKTKQGEVLTELEIHLMVQAQLELSNLKLQESLNNFWWQDKVTKIAQATGLQAP